MLKTSSRHHLKRFPYWLRQSVKVNKGVRDTKAVLQDLCVNTVCQDARCPNIYDCFSRRRCTFLILGERCTRGCGFCAIACHGDLKLPDKEKPLIIKEAVKRLRMRHVVITSVTRDDLADGGAGHFADCIRTLRGFDPSLHIEVLVPDFLGERDSIEKVVCERPDIFSHNIETVPRLYAAVRRKADYNRSMAVLKYAKEKCPAVETKSGIMVGLGETRNEVDACMRDLREAGCDMLTIGQYLKPDPRCLDVEEFLDPGEFGWFSDRAQELGFKRFSCSPFTRSSYLE